MDGYMLTVTNESGIFSGTTIRTRLMTKITLSSSGTSTHFLWNDQKNSWDTIWISPQYDCEVYGKCGPFGFCNWKHSPPICSCLTGFKPSNEEAWRKGNWSDGCVRKTQLQCYRSNSTSGGGGKEDGFFRMQSMQLPDLPERFPAGREEDCRSLCLRSCSCLDYAYDSFFGCMIWRKGLIDTHQYQRRSTDMQNLQGDLTQDLYIRLASSELGNHNGIKPWFAVAVAGNGTEGTVPVPAS